MAGEGERMDYLGLMVPGLFLAVLGVLNQMEKK